MRIVLVLMVVLLSGCVATMDSSLLVQRTAPKTDFVVRNATVFDGFQFGAEQDVWVKSGKIQAVGKNLEVPEEVKIIRGEGRTLLPGLIDMHVHLLAAGAPPWRTTLGSMERTLSANLAMGVTSVLDMGAPIDDISSWQNDTALKMPRYAYAGTLFNIEHGHPSYMIEKSVFWPLSSIIKRKMISELETISDARDFIDEHKEAGASMIKIVMDEIPLDSPVMAQELLNALVEYAHQQNLKVVAHIGAEEELLKGITAKVDLFVHGLYRSGLSSMALGKLKSSGIPVVPTSVVWDQLALFYQDELSFNALEHFVVDSEIEHAYGNRPDSLELDPSIIAWFDTLLDYRQEKFAIIDAMYRAKVPLFIGSDSPNVGSVAGATVHKEMALWQQHTGLKSEAILAAATGHSGQWLEQYLGWKVGQVKAGYDADLLLVQGDVSKDITLTQGLDNIWIGGQLVESKLKSGKGQN